MTATPTVTERLAEYVVEARFEDLPASVIEHAKDLIVYNLSRVFARRFTEAGRETVTLAVELSAGASAATVVAHTERAALLDAIYAHSELIGDPDAHHRAKLLAGLVAHPVAWVLGERERASGRELITALVLGYEVACKLAEPVPMAGDYARMPHKCAFGPFAGGAIAARLLRHDRARAAATLARAAHYGMGTNEGYSEAGVFGLMARSAVVGALLPPLVSPSTLRAIESPHGLYAALFGGVPSGLEESVASLGHEYSILDSLTKRYPGSASHVAPILAARDMVEEAGLRAGDLESMVAVVPEEFRGRFAKREATIEQPAPRESDLIMSLRLRLAVMLVEGAVVSPTLAHLRAPAVREMLAKIQLEFEPRPEEYARIEVRTLDGRQLRREGKLGPSPKGDWAKWLRQDGQRFLSDGRLAHLEHLLTNLEDVSDVGEVLRITVPDRVTPL